MKAKAMKFAKVALILLGVWLLLGALPGIDLEDYKQTIRGQKKNVRVMREGILPEQWTQFDLPEGSTCSVYPQSAGAFATIRPNGEEKWQLTMDFYETEILVATQEVVRDRLPVRTRFLLYRGEGESVGKPYQIRCL